MVCPSRPQWFHFSFSLVQVESFMFGWEGRPMAAKVADLGSGVVWEMLR